MAFNLKGKTMAEATQMLDQALDKSDVGEQIINGIVKIEDTDGNPIEVIGENQVITKSDWKNLSSKRYIILKAGDAVKQSYLPFTSAVYDNYNINDLALYPTRIYIPDGVTNVRFCINYYVPIDQAYAKLSLIKDGDDSTSEKIFYCATNKYAAFGDITVMTQVIDVKNVGYVQIYVDDLGAAYSNEVISFNNVTMEVIQ